MSRYKKRGWFREPRRHSLAAQGMKTKFNYLLLKERLEEQERQEIIRRKLGNADIPADVKEQGTMELVEDTEGLSREAVEESAEAFIREFRPIEEKLRFKLGKEPSEKDIQVEELAQAFTESDVATSIRNLKRDRELAEMMQNAALNTVVTEENRQILTDLLRGRMSDENLKNVELWDGDTPSFNVGTRLEFKRTGYGTQDRQIWAVRDDKGNAAFWEYMPKSKKVRINSPGGEEVFEEG